MDFIKGAFKTVKNTISGGMSDLANAAADTAADVALAPLNLIEKQLKSVANLGPDIVAKRRKAINDMLTEIESNAVKYDEETARNERSQAVTTIERRVAEINSDSNVPDYIKQLYRDIDVKDENISPDKLIDALAGADDALLVHEDKQFEFVRLIKRAWRISSDYIYRILVLFAIIFGGTILSNAYIHEEFWAIRFYYFVYGVIFFPLALIYGAVNPPAWNATIFPMYKNIVKQINVPTAEIMVPLQGGMTTNPTTQLGGADDSPLTPIHIKGSSGKYTSGPITTGESLTERFNLIVMSLFGYKFETDTLTMRILSIVLAGSVSTWAFYRGDLNQFLYYANKWTAKK